MQIALDDRWSIGGHPHGGYLLRETVAPLVSAQHPHPLAVSAHFLRSPDPGPVVVETETLRAGRRVSQHRARLLQHGETVLEALVTTGSLDASSEPHWQSVARPELPPVEQCPRSAAEPVPGFRIGHLDFVDVHAAPPGPGQVSAHVQMASGSTSVLDLLVLADALPPTAMGLGIPGWFPTVELTLLIRAVPADGWLIGEQHSTLFQDGWFEEDCVLWDSAGRIVCQARQLAGYRL